MNNTNLARTSYVRVMLTEDEKRALKNQSKNNNIGMSELIRDIVFYDKDFLGERLKFTPEQFHTAMVELSNLSEEVGKLETQVVKIGVNLNQIARVMNQTQKGFDESELSSEIERLNYVLDEILDKTSELVREVRGGVL